MATSYLTGVYEDGSTPAPGDVLPQRAVLRVPKGRATTVRLFTRNAGGLPIRFPDWASITLTVRAHTDDLVAVYSGSFAADVARGSAWAVLTIPATAFDAYPAGRYVYGIAGVIGGATVDLVAASALLVSPSV